MKIGISGHQKLPGAAYDLAVQKITDLTSQFSSFTGVTSLAVGADQLFAELVLASGNKLHVVIPCRDYKKTFGEESLARYQQLLSAADTVEELEYVEPSEKAFYAAGKRVADLSDEMIAVWDGLKSNGLGGTADVVEYARSKGKKVHVFWPDGVKR